MTSTDLSHGISYGDLMAPLEEGTTVVGIFLKSLKIETTFRCGEGGERKARATPDMRDAAVLAVKVLVKTKWWE